MSDAPHPDMPHPDMPKLAVAGFAGPLDWLLEMARAQRLDLARLPIAALIDAFATALQAALAGSGAEPGAKSGEAAGRLTRWGDWLVMAAQLVALRSALLLPQGTAETAAAEALRRSWLARADAAAAADWLARRPQLGQQVFARGGVAAAAPGRNVAGGDIAELLRACLLVLRVSDQEAGMPAPPARPPLWPMQAALARIERLLAAQPNGATHGAALAEALPPLPAHPARPLQARAALASTLLAGLELARAGRLALEQPAPWGPIRLHAAAPGVGALGPGAARVAAFDDLP